MVPTPLRPVRRAADQPPLLAELVAFYLEHHRHHVRPRTYETDAWALRGICEYLGHVPAPEVSTRMVLSYQHQRLAAGVSPGSVNRELAPLRAMYRWAVDVGHLEANPIAGVRSLPKPPERLVHRRRALTEEEVDRFLEAARQDDVRARKRWGKTIDQYPLWVSLIDTGARFGELASAVWASVDLESGAILLRAVHTKSKRTRTVPISGRVGEALRRLVGQQRVYHDQELDPGWRVYQSRRGGRLYKSNALKHFHALRRLAGVAYEDAHGEKVDIHALRHTAASRMARAGVPIGTAARILGHSTPALTEAIYTHRTVDDLRDAIQRVARACRKGESDADATSSKPMRASDAGESASEVRPHILKVPGLRPTQVVALTRDSLGEELYVRLLEALSRGPVLLTGFEPGRDS